MSDQWQHADTRQALDAGWPALIGYWGLDLRNRLANDAFSEFFGLRPHEVAGGHLRDVLGQHLFDLSLPSVERVLAGRSQVLDQSVTDARGRRRHVRIAFTPQANAGALDGFFMLVTDITDRQPAELELEASEERFRLMVDAVEDYAILMLDPEGRILTWNAGAERIKGYRAEEIIGRHLSVFYLPEDAAAGVVARALDTAARNGRFATEGWRVRKDGDQFWASAVITALRNPDGSIHGYCKITRDRTEQRSAELLLAASQARFSALVEHSSDIICLLDRSAVLTYVNPAIERVLGIPAPEALGRRMRSLVDPADSTRIMETLASLPPDGAPVSTSTRLATAGGGWCEVDLTAANRLEDPDVAGIVINIRDVSERAEAAQRLSWYAFHDTLTGLPNRALVLDRIDQALRQARRRRGRTALLFIDLDRFKSVNDTFGHGAGDRLLAEVAKRLTACVRAEDTVARLGGDEFVVLVPGLSSPEEASRLAQRVCALISEPVDLGGTTTEVTASIGIAFDDDDQPETLLRAADNALYRAKADGKNRVQVFDLELLTEANHRINVERTLRRVLAHDEVVVHYQPIVSLATGDVASVEALLRIVTAPGAPLDPPGDYVMLAEEIGLINELGGAVLDKACAQLRQWVDRGPPTAPRQVAVNVAARQLSTDGFTDLVRAVLARHGLAPEQLVLELTESTIIGADRSTTRSVADLHQLGVKLAVDDFGTGYSSLTYLKRFPVDIVKIDRSFVDGLGTDPNDTAIVNAIVSLGHSLGLDVVGEGIETAAQLEALRSMGCDYGQGYLIQRPEAAAPGAAWPAATRAAP